MTRVIANGSRIKSNVLRINLMLLGHGQWFSPASSTIKTGCRDDIAEIYAERGVKTPK